MKCVQCNKEIDGGDTIIPVIGWGEAIIGTVLISNDGPVSEDGFLCGMVCESRYSQKKDMEFLLSFTPYAIEESLPKGLSPEFYHSLSYEGDVKIAKRIEYIRERYGLSIRRHRSKDNGQG